MVNAWSLAYEELNGTMDETYPIKKEKSDVDEEVTLSSTLDQIEKSGGFEWTPGSPWPPEIDSYEHSDAYYDYTRNDPNAKNPFTDPKDMERAERVSGDINMKVSLKEDEPIMKEFSINKSDYRKYEEDKGIKDLQEYVTSTYNGHYTTKGSNVQTLDLIESVGDAPSFCRSNAIKYLSRYEKKGQAKRDILKAMHYCLLLYYFSGQTHDNEIQRGYETF